MTGRKIRASAPGTLMLFGEHAVLRGEPALVAAGNLRLTVELEEQDSRSIELHSKLGNWTCSLENFQPDPRFRFLSEIIAPRLDLLPGGFLLNISSDIDQTVGLGSSAAVTVATVAVLRRWCGEECSGDSIFDESLRAVRSVQGRASGADLAAAVEGGIVHFKAGNRRRLQCSLPEIMLIYSGSKLATPEVIRLVDHAAARQPELFNNMFQLMGSCSEQAAKALEENDQATFASLMDVGQGLMDAIGVSNDILSELVYTLRAQPGIHAAKISGSGLGDCVIGLGQAPWTRTDCPLLDVQLSAKGLELSEISH